MKYKISKSDWEKIGNEMGWLKHSERDDKTSGNDAKIKKDKVYFFCTNLQCQKYLAFPSTLRGEVVECYRCGNKMRIPEKNKKTN